MQRVPNLLIISFISLTKRWILQLSISSGLLESLYPLKSIATTLNINTKYFEIQRLTGICSVVRNTPVDISSQNRNHKSRVQTKGAFQSFYHTQHNEFEHPGKSIKEVSGKNTYVDLQTSMKPIFLHSRFIVRENAEEISKVPEPVIEKPYKSDYRPKSNQRPKGEQPKFLPKCHLKQQK